MADKKEKTELSEILKRLGIGFHVLGLIMSIMALIIVVILGLPLLLIWIPFYFIGGWGIRWILTGEKTNIIPFYENLKSTLKKFSLNNEAKDNIFKILAFVAVSSIIIFTLIAEPYFFVLFFLIFCFLIYVKQKS